MAKSADKLAAVAEKAAKSAEKAQSKGGKGKAFWWVAGTAAAAGGAYVVWKKSQPEVDPWAEPWEKVEGSTFDDFVEETKDAVGHAAEVVGEAAGVTVAKTKETAEELAEKAAEAREDLAEKVDEVKASAKKAAEKVRSAAPKPKAPAKPKPAATEDVPDPAAGTDTVEKADGEA